MTARARDLRNQGVVIYAIGVANANIGQLNRIATDPDRDHVFFLNSFNDISGFVDTMSAVTCSGQLIQLRLCYACLFHSSYATINTLLGNAPKQSS